MKNNRFLRHGFLQVLILLFPIVVYLILKISTNLETSELHFIVFPLAMLCFALLFIKRYLVYLFLFFVPFYLISLRYTFSFSVDRSFSGVVLSKLKDDRQESAGIMLREQILRFARYEQGDKFKRYYHLIRSHKQAIRSFPRAKVIVWGSYRQLMLSFQPYREGFTSIAAVSRPVVTVKGREDPLVNKHKVRNFQIISYIPGISLPYAPVAEAGFYLTSIAQAEELRAQKSEEAFAKRLDAYMAAGLQSRANWKSAMHLAYPWFQIGNIYLEQALENNYGNQGLIECAKKAYRRASYFLQAKEHPILRASIFNNQAIVYMLDSSGGIESLRKAQRLLVNAEKQIQLKSLWKPKGYVTKAIKENIKKQKAFFKKFSKKAKNKRAIK